MANLSPKVSPKEAQAVLDTTTKIMNAQTSQTRNGQVFYPTIVAKQGATSPQKWARMSNAEKTLCIMINLCAEIEIAKSSRPQHHGGHGSLGALGYSSFKEGTFQSGSKKSAGKFGWSVKSGGKYKSVTDPQLGKDVYAFQHYAEYSSGSSNPNIKTNNPPSDPFGDRTDVKNRDGIIGQSTLDMLVAMKNSSFQKVSQSANNIASAGADLARKLVANLSHPDLNSPANPALVPQENKKMDCSTIAESRLLAPGSENDPAFKHCADYIRQLRARAASRTTQVKSVTPQAQPKAQPKAQTGTGTKKGGKKTTSTTTTRTTVPMNMPAAAEKPWYSIFTENPILTGVGAVAIIGGIAYALSGSDEEVEEDSEESSKKDTKQQQGQMGGYGQQGQMGYGQQGQMGYGQQGQMGGYGQQGQMGYGQQGQMGYGQQGQMGYGQQQGQMGYGQQQGQMGGYGQQQRQIGYEQPVSTPRSEVTPGVMNRDRNYVTVPMQEGAYQGDISNPRKRKGKKKTSSKKKSSVSHSKVSKGSKRVVGASKKRSTKKHSTRKH